MLNNVTDKSTFISMIGNHSNIVMKPSNRILHLEALRGIASIIVVFHHFTLAFYPSFHQAGEGIGALIYQSPFFF